MNLFGIIFTKSKLITKQDENHENIHTVQYIELGFLLFPVVYILNFIINVFIYWNFHKAYRNILLELEAYDNQNNLDYLKTRKHYAWIKYIKKNKEVK